MDLNRVCACVNLDNMMFNLKAMKDNIPADSEIMAVLKTNGYGTGAVALAKELEKVDYVHGYCLATADEAMELRKNNIQKPILILGYTFEDSYEDMAKNGIRPTIFSLEAAREFDEACRKANVVGPIHIAIDTGMSRIGFQVTEADADVVEEISKLKNIEIEGIFTHFARCDERDKSHALQQQELFEKMLGFLQDRDVKYTYSHSANSAAILEFDRAHAKLVRAGVTLYGMWPSDEIDTSFPLKSIMEIKSHVVHVKDLEPGRAISYGGTFVVEKPMRVATIPVGYGDGYPRSLSNKGYVLIHGAKAPILGRVCMDQFMVDVTDIPNVSVLDEVTIIGRDGDLEITFEELGELSNRFNYELACGLGNRRIPHIYYKDGAKVDEMICL
jgi:alanine racemase